MEQRQLWELSLRKGLPELARLILAGGITEDLVAADPQGYVRTGWLQRRSNPGLLLTAAGRVRDQEERLEMVHA